MTTLNPYAPPQAEVGDFRSAEPAPALWNPNAAANWSLLFSPIFGAVLHMKNWEALGEPAKAAASKKWAIGVLVFFVVMTVVSAMAPESKALDGLTRLIGFALLLTWYFSMGRAQQRYVLAKFGKTYPRRGWGKPILYAILALLAFFVVVFVVAFAFTLAAGRA